MWLDRNVVFSQMLRIQSPEGTRRIEISDSSPTAELYEKVF